MLKGRTSKAIIDDLGRVMQSEVTGLLPVSVIYDRHGRLETISQGTGPDERTARLTYNPQGYLDTTTDPLGMSQLSPMTMQDVSNCRPCRAGALSLTVTMQTAISHR